MDLTKFFKCSTSPPAVAQPKASTRNRLRTIMENKGKFQTDRVGRAAKIKEDRRSNRLNAMNMRRGISDLVTSDEDAEEVDDRKAPSSAKAVREPVGPRYLPGLVTRAATAAAAAAAPPSSSRMSSRRHINPSVAVAAAAADDGLPQAVRDRMAKLEEFRRRKALIKAEQAKCKKPPFLVGVAHHAFDHSLVLKNGSFKFANTTVARDPYAKGRVFVFGEDPNAHRSVPVVGPEAVANRPGKLGVSGARSASSLRATPCASRPASEERPKKRNAAGKGKKVVVVLDPPATTTPLALINESLSSSCTVPAATPASEKDCEDPSNTSEARLREEARDTVPESLIPITPRSMKKTPRRLGEVARLHDSLRSEVCFERGSYSDRRKREKGQTPKLLTEILGIDDEVEHLDYVADSASPALPSRSSTSTPPCEGRSAGKGRRRSVASRTSKTEMEKAGSSEEQSELSVARFRVLLAEETAKLEGFCDDWEIKLKERFATRSSRNPDEEEVAGQIRATIGKARILMAKKGRFQQFHGLIDNCEFGYGEKKTTCTDLQGFWDMIYFQVEDVSSQFKELEHLESNGWKHQTSAKKSAKKPLQKIVVSAAASKRPVSAAQKRPQVKPKAPGPSNALKEMLAEKRKAMKMSSAASSARSPSGKFDGEVNDDAGAKLPLVPAVKASNAAAEEFKTFEGGFFSICSPRRAFAASESITKSNSSRSATLRTPSSSKIAGGKKALRRSGVSSGSASTPLAVIRATMAIRKSLSRDPVQVSAGGSTPLNDAASACNEAQKVPGHKGTSRTPSVRVKINFDEAAGEDKENEGKTPIESKTSDPNPPWSLGASVTFGSTHHYLSPFNAKVGAPESKATKEDDLMSFDSPAHSGAAATSKTPSRRSVRLSCKGTPNYKC